MKRDIEIDRVEWVVGSDSAAVNVSSTTWFASTVRGPDWSASTGPPKARRQTIDPVTQGQIAVAWFCPDPQERLPNAMHSKWPHGSRRGNDQQSPGTIAVIPPRAPAGRCGWDCWE